MLGTLLAAGLALAPASAPVPVLAGAPVPAGLAGARGGTIKVKLATLVPEGTPWDKSLRKMAAEIKRDTGGRVELRIYPGGVAGDEPDIVRKMRIGQLHSAMLTTTGLALIDESFRMFEVPMFFETDAELVHVLERISPLVEERLENKGYALLSWGPTGWVHFFSTKPIQSVEELRKLKLFVWAADNYMLRWWREHDFRVVPLAMTDVLTGLQTGMIEAMPSTPLAAISLQWFRQAPHMIEPGVLPMIGATIISLKTWNKIDAADREAMLAAGRRSQVSLFDEIPKKEKQSIEEMKKRGLTTRRLEAGPGELSWEALASSFAETLRADERVPAEIFDAAEREREAFRAARTGD